MSTRSSFIDILTPLLPAGWKIDPSRRPSDAITKRTVVVSRVREIKRTPATPQGSRTSTLIVTLIEPDTDIDAGGDKLEDAVELLLTSIEKCPKQISHGDVTAVKWGDQYPNAFDIPIEVITPKEPPRA